ncbi:MAG TPA: SDR family oxidoreductase [Longimicrobiales bacterium]|nr:SDR family oxidoreductase [Longimicrobiales bacterium]
MPKPRGRRGAMLAAATLAYLAWRAWRRRDADLAGRVVLITGGSRGLGLVMAREFARHGCRVAICARDPQELERARADLEARGADAAAFTCDVARENDARDLVARVTERFGGIDILVNNAGIIQVGPLRWMTLADFEREMAVNFWGGVHATLAVLPQMRHRRAGRIVNITSIGGEVAIPHLLPYSCSKAAAVAFSEGTRAELARYGISVTTVVPGLMRTGSPVNAFFKGSAAAEFTWFSLGDATPLTAMSAERAARRIVRAARHREAEVTLSWQARALRLVRALAPGATADALAVVNRILPGPEGGRPEARRGMQLATRLSPSPLTILMNRAARRNNEFGGAARPARAHARKIGLEEA